MNTIQNGLKKIKDDLTLLDYFAGQALQGITACKKTDFDTYDNRAMFAYKQAEAMLAERARRMK